MNFQDEFEFESSNGNTYYVYVTGSKYLDNGLWFNSLDEIQVRDELGELVDEHDEVMSEVTEEAVHRDYDLEIHSTDNSFYSEIDYLE
jgi:hypothetical protein